MPILTERLIQNGPLRQQEELEERAIHDGVLRYRKLVAHAHKKGRAVELKPYERLFLHWMEPMRIIMRDEKTRIRKNVGRDVWARPIILGGLNGSTMSLIAMREAVGMLVEEPDGVAATRCAYAIGRGLMAEINVRLETRARNLARKELRARLKADGVPENEIRRAVSDVSMPKSELADAFNRLTASRVMWWARKNAATPIERRRMAIAAGSVLLRVMCDACSANDYMDEVFEPCFVTSNRNRAYGTRNRITKWVSISDAALDRVEEAHAARQYLKPLYRPMIFPPNKWVEGDGGYVTLKTGLVTKGSYELRTAHEEADLSRVHDAVDWLNATPHRINPRVLEVMLALKPEGNVAGLPHRHNLPYPKPPVPGSSDEARDEHDREIGRLARENKARFRDRAIFEQQLAEASDLAGRDAIYFPHQLDFRGRVYPKPSYFHHQMNDVCRGLLESAEAKPLGSDGEFWVRVHLANCWGEDKRPFAERVQWTEANEELIRDCARDPLNNRWWTMADGGDSPWQFLAACMALDDPKRHGGRLWVQLDGSNNGTQHASAMMRDEWGGSLVNLIPTDAPADLYGEVVADANRMIDEDARRGVGEACVAAGIVDRACGKQPVMTRYYGVTGFGASRQIENKLDKKLAGMGLPKKTIREVSWYVSKKILEAVGSRCPGGESALNWIEAASTAWAKAKEPMRWASPIGYPVVQAGNKYRSYTVEEIGTVLGRLEMRDFGAPGNGVKAKKQVRGAAPNFVHTLDASHLMMTALACRDDGLRLATVHDSFWSVPADTHALGVSLRDQFAKMHSKPLLYDLAEQMQRTRPDIELPELPPLGNLNVGDIRGSLYAFA